VEEADETMYWLELLAESKAVPGEKLELLQVEAQELTAIFTAARHTSRQK
jgi:hypothetical protein